MDRNQEILGSGNYGSAIKERQNSPLVGPFAIFVLLWNLEPVLLLLFGGQETAVVISGIKQDFSYLQWVVYPLVSTVVYLLIYPLVAGFLNTWRSVANRFVYKLSDTITTREDALMLERVKRLEHSDLAEELRDLSEEVETLVEETRGKSDHLVQLTKDHAALVVEERSTLQQIEEASNNKAKSDTTLKALKADAKKRNDAIEMQRVEFEKISKNSGDLTQKLDEAKVKIRLKTKEINSIKREVDVTIDVTESLKDELEKSRAVNSNLEKVRDESKQEKSNPERDAGTKKMAKGERDVVIPFVPEDENFIVLLDENLSEFSLEHYTEYMYPTEGWDPELARDLVSRIDLQVYKTIAEIHRVIIRYSAAVGIFAQKCDLIRTSTDYIVHSLGFHDQQIRVTMGFSKPSLAAFQEYDELGLVLGLFEENVSAPEYKLIVLLRSEKVESEEIAEMIKKYRIESVDSPDKAMVSIQTGLDKMHVSPGSYREIKSILTPS